MIYHGVCPNSRVIASLHPAEENRMQLPSRRRCMIKDSSLLPSPSSSAPKRANHPPSRNALPITSQLIDCHLQRRWLHSLVNSAQQKEQDNQLTPTVHQLHFPSSTGASCSSKNVFSHKLVSKVPRRPRCSTFEEHLQRYYASNWSLTSTRDIGRARLSCNSQF